MKYKFYKTIKILLSAFILVILIFFMGTNLASADHCQQGYVHGPDGNCITYTWDSGGESTTTITTDPNLYSTTQTNEQPVEPKKEVGLASDTVYEYLAPFSDQYKIFDVKDGSCPFGRYANMMIIIFFGIAAVLAMIMIIAGGIEYMTSELVSSKEAGKEKITHAVLGLLLALGAWLILNTINPNLLNLCFKVDILEFEINSPDTPHQANAKGEVCANPGYKTMTDGEKTKWDDKIANITKLPTGVTASISGGGFKECTEVGELGCTSTRGLDTSMVAKIKEKCPNCVVEITGGTECWRHSRIGTHKPGSSTVDLRYHESLNTYIKDGKFLRKASKGGWPIYSQHGIYYMEEGNHWHVWR